MPSAHDDRDHKETRLLLAAAVALILLVAIVWDLLLRRIREFLGPVRGRAGSQERGADFFRRLSRRDPGHGRRVGRRRHLRRAAVHHFLIFFVVFWLMIAWIF